jgi:CxxC motif-containing protein
LTERKVKAMKTTELTCIVCPMGCTLTVTQDEEGKILSVTGNTCPRGAVYGENELLHPVRTLTTTVRTKGGRLLPVKTDKPIPKEHLCDAMEQVNRLSAPDDAKIGDVLLADLFGANLVATADLC